MQICHTEKSRSSSPSSNVFANQVESWDDEAAANAEEGDDQGLVLQRQIAKERELATKVMLLLLLLRELATKVVKIFEIGLVPLSAIIMSYAGKLGSS